MKKSFEVQFQSRSRNLKPDSLEIHSRRGAVVWRGGGLRKSQYNTFTLALTRRAIPAGEYQIKLYGLSDSRRELIESYSVRIQYQ